MKNITEILKKEDVLVVDVRNSWEYEEGHVNNALNIPLNEIPARIEEFKKSEWSCYFILPQRQQEWRCSTYTQAGRYHQCS